VEKILIYAAVKEVTRTQVSKIFDKVFAYASIANLLLVILTNFFFHFKVVL